MSKIPTQKTISYYEWDDIRDWLRAEGFYGTCELWQMNEMCRDVYKHIWDELPYGNDAEAQGALDYMFAHLEHNKDEDFGEKYIVVRG